MAKGKLVLQGIIELLSPACIGSGKKDYTEIDVLLDNNGKPFIPATSLVGVLKHFIKKNAILDDKNALKRFWGFTSEEKISKEEKEKQSDLGCSDLIFSEGNDMPSTRDGIKIDNRNGRVAKGAKYDYQVAERGAKFKLHLELNLTDTNREFSRRMVATIRSVLEQGFVQIGAKTNSGLGKMQLTNARVREFDFKEKGDVFRWLRRDFSTPKPFTEQPFEIQSKMFSIHAVFTLKNSFISRSYSANQEEPDAVSIKSGDSFVIPGTSLKGAIRARAERILQTLGKPPDILHNLFGYVDEGKDTTEETKEGTPITPHPLNSPIIGKGKKVKIKGRISIEESLLPDYKPELQIRIKTDRFTGGTVEAALFETMPLFSDSDDTKRFCVSITVRNYKDHEAGLLLLVLKDLWTGDLAVGGEKGIGRGVLKGQKATISWNTRTITLEENISGTSNDIQKELQRFVEALLNYGKGACPHG